MSLRAIYPNPLVLHGSHSTPGDQGTTLTYDVFLVDSGMGEVSAYLDVGTYASSTPRNHDEAQVYACAATRRDALTRLSSYLRRVADSIDAGLEGLELPARLGVS